MAFRWHSPLLPDIVSTNVRGDKSIHFGNLVWCRLDILIRVDNDRPQIDTYCIVDHDGIADMTATWRVMLVSSAA
jgi:hypothetical protein